MFCKLDILRHSEEASVSLFVELALIAHVISTSASSWSGVQSVLIRDPDSWPPPDPDLLSLLWICVYVLVQLQL